MSELEQSGERLARAGRTFEQRSEQINTLVKQYERALQQERQVPRYHGLTRYDGSEPRNTFMICAH